MKTSTNKSPFSPIAITKLSDSKCAEVESSLREFEKVRYFDLVRIEVGIMVMKGLYLIRPSSLSVKRVKKFTCSWMEIFFDIETYLIEWDQTKDDADSEHESRLKISDQSRRRSASSCY